MCEFINAVEGVIDAIAGARIECVVLARNGDLAAQSYDKRKLPVIHELYGEGELLASFIECVWFGYDTASLLDEGELQYELPF